MKEGSNEWVVHLASYTRVLISFVQMARNGWTNLDPWRATKDVITPAVAGLTAMIIFPALGFLGLKRLFPVGTFADDFLCALLPFCTNPC